MDIKKIKKLLYITNDISKNTFSDVAIIAKATGYAECLIDLITMQDQGLTEDIIKDRLKAKFNAIYEALK